MSIALNNQPDRMSDGKVVGKISTVDHIANPTF